MTDWTFPRRLRWSLLRFARWFWVVWCGRSGVSVAISGFILAIIAGVIVLAITSHPYHADDSLNCESPRADLQFCETQQQRDEDARQIVEQVQNEILNAAPPATPVAPSAN